jgi:putative two-component system response regulator
MALAPPLFRVGNEASKAMAERVQSGLRSTVLVVDDEAGTRESLRMILAPRHRLLQAESAARALEILRREQIDLITIDLHMPGMKGGDLIRIAQAEYPELEAIVITGCGPLEGAVQDIPYGISDYLQKPFDAARVVAAVERALSRRQSRARLAAFREELGRVVSLDREADSILRGAGCREGLAAERFQARGGPCGAQAQRPEPPAALELLGSLTERIEGHRFTCGHARRVALLSSLVAERLGLASEEREQIRIAAFLHDLGEVGVPLQLLLRGGALGSAERGLVEQHPEIAARLLRPLDVSPAIALAIRHHHEWWDGTGYPDGLAAEQIPLGARVIAVADAFDAMSCERPYRPALDRERVIDELERFAAIQFDALIVKEFLSLLESGAEDADLELLVDAVTQTAQVAPPTAAAG